jgi:hypothetical protein
MGGKNKTQTKGREATLDTTRAGVTLTASRASARSYPSLYSGSERSESALRLVCIGRETHSLLVWLVSGKNGWHCQSTTTAHGSKKRRRNQEELKVADREGKAHTHTHRRTHANAALQLK